VYVRDVTKAQKICDIYQDTTDITFLQGLSTIGTEGKIRLHVPPAGGAPLLPHRVLSTHTVATLIEDGIAILTDKKGGAPFHRKQRYKKQTHIVIHPLERNIEMPARRA